VVFRYSSDDEEATYRAIGRFMFEFSQLEYAIRYYTALELGVKEEMAHVVMSHDVALLCTVATEVPTQKSDEKHKQELRDIIKQVRKINETRVKVAHGLWVPFTDGGTVHHQSRSPLKTTISAEQAKELELGADQTNHIRDRLEKWWWGSRNML
jgi:hypothetical protein